MQRRFAPIFSTGMVQAKLIEVLKNRNSELRDEAEVLRARLDAAEGKAAHWMKRCLDEEFRAKRASGCYTNCPVMKPRGWKPPADCLE